MKQKKFWSKLLSLGLAAAMTIASLTGPGSVTNPVEVKAATQGTLESATLTVNGTEVQSGSVTTPTEVKATENGNKPTKIDVKVTSMAAISITIGEVPSTGVVTGSGLKVTFKFGDNATNDFNQEGLYTVTVEPVDETYTSNLTLTYKLVKDSGSTTDPDDPKDPTTPTDPDDPKDPTTPTDPTEKSAKPTITGAGGVTEFTSTLEVTITAAAGAKIYYTTDGSAPTEKSTAYEKAFTIDKDTTVKAIAVETGKAVSETAEQKFIKKSTSGGNTGGNTSTGGSTGGSSTTTPSTGNTTTTTETKPDGTKVETTTETKADGTKVETVTETKKDGSATTTVKETEKNASGKEVAVTTVTEKDASGKVQSETTTSVIAKADTNTSATVTTVKDSKGAVTATAEVKKTGTTDETGKTKGTISATVIKQITEAAGTANVEISQTVTNGDKKFTVKANAKDLVSGSKMKIMKLDPKTGEYVLCNKKSYAVNAAGDVDLSIKTDGDFILVNEADAKAASDAVLKTVKVKSSSKTVTKGKSTTVAMSSGLNMKNVSKITYTVSNKSVATVSKNGKVTTKKAGTVTVKAKVTLKNGKTKTVTMKIKVK